MNISGINSKKTFLLLGMVLIVVLTWILPSPAQPSSNPVYEWQIEGKADENFNEAQFRLWLPPKIKPKGILVVLQGSGMCGLHLADDPGWQKLATELEYALLAYYLSESSNGKLFHHVEQGSGQALIEGLNRLAQNSGHRELDTLPLALAGFSVGGQFSYHFSQWRPERTSAFITMKGGYHRMPLGNVPTVPGLLILGENDADFRVKNLSEVFTEGRKRQAPWQLVAEPGAGHACENASKLVAPFLVSVLLPDKDQNPMDLGFTKSAACFLENPAQCPLPQMSFESRQPQPLAFASVSQLDFGPVPWNQSSDWKAFTLQSPIDPPVFDTFQASSLRGLIEIKSGQSETISVRIAPKAEQILGSFHDEVRVTFYKKKKKQLGCLRFPVQFKSIGDLELSPSFLWGNKAALEKGQEISLQIISSQEKPLEYLGLQSNLQHLNERWEDQGQGRYRFTCTVKSAAATAVKETLTLTFKTASGTITRPVQIVFK